MREDYRDCTLSVSKEKSLDGEFLTFINATDKRDGYAIVDTYTDNMKMPVADCMEELEAVVDEYLANPSIFRDDATARICEGR